MRRAFLLALCIFFISAGMSEAAGIARPANNLGLAGYWSFDEGLGTQATDFSGNGNAGTLTNSPAWANGRYLGALEFSSTTSSYVVYGNPPSLALTGDLTISIWVNPSAWNDVANVGKNPILEGRISGTGAPYTLYASPTMIRFQQHQTSGGDVNHWYIISISTPVPLNAWTLVTVTRSGSAITIYKNGVPVGSGTADGPIDTTFNGLRVGRGQYDVTYNWNGKLDDLRMYNRALSGSEVAALYNSNTARQSRVDNANLAAYWRFDDGSGTSARDSSGRNNTGTLSGSTLPTWTTGKYEGGLSFGGSTSYVSAGNPFLGNTDFTIALWVKPTAINTGSYQGFIGRQSGGGSWTVRAPGMWVGPNSGALHYDSYDGAGSTRYTNLVSNFFTAAGQWVFITWVKNGTRYDIYRNGALFLGGDTAPATFYNSGTDYDIGRVDNYLNGAIDDVHIYNRALSSDEVAALYRGTAVTLNASAAKLQQGTTLSSGLIGHWTFDGPDVSGTTVTDKGSGGHNGTLTNGPKPAAGKLGQGMHFDGTDDYMITTNMGSQASSLSLGMWFKADSLANVNQALLSIQDSTTPISGYHYTPMGIYGSKLTGSLWDVGNITSSTSLEANVWYHAMLTYDSSNSTQKLYLNGELVGQNTGSLTTPGVNMYFYLGQRQQSCSLTNASGLCATDEKFFNGTLDDFRYYNRALSASEVKQLYLMGK